MDMVYTQSSGIDLFSYMDSINFEISKNDFIKIFNKEPKEVKLSNQLESVLSLVGDDFTKQLELALNGNFNVSLPNEYIIP